MFCPKCGAEFVKGIKVCSDCGVPLAKEVPPQPKPKYRELTEVFSTSQLAEAAVVKTMLESSGISCYLYNAHYPAMASTGIAVPIKVMADKNSEQAAREIINNFLAGNNKTRKR